MFKKLLGEAESCHKEALALREIDDVCPSKTSSDPYAEEDFFVPPSGRCVA